MMPFLVDLLTDAEGIPFVAEVLDSTDTAIQEDALLALGNSRRRDAFEILQDFAWLVAATLWSLSARQPLSRKVPFRETQRLAVRVGVASPAAMLWGGGTAIGDGGAFGFGLQTGASVPLTRKRWLPGDSLRKRHRRPWTGFLRAKRDSKWAPWRGPREPDACTGFCPRLLRWLLLLFAIGPLAAGRLAGRASFFCSSLPASGFRTNWVSI
jgi:hypothetical protein